MPDAARLEHAASWQELSALNALYCSAVDRLDAVLLQSLFRPDATVDFPFLKGSAATFAAETIAFERQRSATFHTCPAMWFKIAGDDAIGEIRLIGWEQMADAAASIHLAGARYLDRYARRDGTWKFAHRAIVIEWLCDLPPSTFAGAGKLRDANDPFLDLQRAFEDSR